MTPPTRRPERAWILRVLLDEYLGLPFRHEIAEREGVSIALEGRELLVADVLLAVADGDWLTETGAGFYAVANVVASVVAGLGAAFAGVSLAQAVWA